MQLPKQQNGQLKICKIFPRALIASPPNIDTRQRPSNRIAAKGASQPPRSENRTFGSSLNRTSPARTRVLGRRSALSVTSRCTGSQYTSTVPQRPKGTCMLGPVCQSSLPRTLLSFVERAAAGDFVARSVVSSICTIGRHSGRVFVPAHTRR